MRHERMLNVPNIPGKQNRKRNYGKPYSTMKKYGNHDIVVYDYLGKRFDSIIYSGSSDEHRDRAQIEEMYRYKHGIIYLGKGELHKTSKEIKIVVLSPYRPQWTRFLLHCWEVYSVNNNKLENILVN